MKKWFLLLTPLTWLPFFTPFSLATLKVRVFDVGQGNCVLISTADQQYGLLVDAGSNENFFGALYQKLFGHHEIRYWLHASLHENPDDSASDPEEPPSEEEGDSTNSKGEAADTEKQKSLSLLKSRYKTSQIDLIREKLKALEHLAIVVSHPDADHYNLLPELINSKDPEENLIKKVHFALFGGQREHYRSDQCDIQELVKALNQQKVLFFSDEITDRCYASCLDPKNENEKALEQGLANIFGGQARIHILGMNVRDKKPDIQVENRSKEQNNNTLSIVLKIEDCDENQGGSESIIIPGDADGCTWNFVLAAHANNEAILKTDYLLVSHHGACAEGCFREDILNAFSPHYCVISVGNFRSYGHPRAEIINRLERFSLATWNNSCSLLSCYQKVGRGKNNFQRIRKTTNQVILSTLDDGNITFKLNRSSSIVTSRDRSLLDAGPQPRDITFSVVEESAPKSQGKTDSHTSQGTFFQCSPHYHLLVPDPDKKSTFHAGGLYTLQAFTGKKEHGKAIWETRHIQGRR